MTVKWSEMKWSYEISKWSEVMKFRMKWSYEISETSPWPRPYRTDGYRSNRGKKIQSQSLKTCQSVRPTDPCPHLKHLLLIFLIVLQTLKSSMITHIRISRSKSSMIAYIRHLVSTVLATVYGLSRPRLVLHHHDPILPPPPPRTSPDYFELSSVQRWFVMSWVWVQRIVVLKLNWRTGA